nr:PAS domain-containing protein [Tepidiforma sp.]
MRAALEAAPDGIIVVAADGRVVLYNAAFLRLWGLDAAVMELERPALRRAAAARLVRDPEAFLAEAEEVQANPYAVMHRLVELVDGRVLEMHSRPLELSEREAGRIWHYRDVTELVRTRQKLEAATRLAEAQFEGAPYGIIVIALDGRFLRANGRFFAMTGLDATWAELPPPERAARLEALAKEPEQARAFNARWREQPGASFSELFERWDGAWFKVSTQPLRAGGGEVLGQVFFYEDVTAQVVAEQALAESEARLRTMIDEMETGDHGGEPAGGHHAREPGSGAAAGPAGGPGCRAGRGLELGGGAGGRQPVPAVGDAGARGDDDRRGGARGRDGAAPYRQSGPRGCWSRRRCCGAARPASRRRWWRPSRTIRTRKSGRGCWRRRGSWRASRRSRPGLRTG